MSEAEFRTFHSVFSVAVTLLYAGCLTLFLRPFLARQGRGRKLAVVFAVSVVGWLLCKSLPVPQGLFNLFLTAVLVAFSEMLGLEKSLAFLLLLLYYNTRISSGLMAESLYALMERLGPDLANPAKTPEVIYLRAAVFIVLFLLFHLTALAVMLYLLQRRIRKQRISLHGRELCFVGLIPTAGILFGQMISRLLLEFQDGIWLKLYERHPAFLAVIPLMALLFYAGAYLSIAAQQGMAALREKQAAAFAQRQQIQAIQARIREMEQFYAQIRQWKHELRGHLSNISGLVQNKEYASLEEYMIQMGEDISDVTRALSTGNPVTDVIVNDKRQQSQTLDIRFEADFHYPASEAFDAFDVGIILQNLLQNALEACEKVPAGQRFVSLTGRKTGRFFLIEVKNSFAGKVAFGADGLPVTAKKDTAIHGIGLSNVRREARKYMGELELHAEGQEFSAAVLLQERSSL